MARMWGALMVGMFAVAGLLAAAPARAADPAAAPAVEDENVRLARQHYKRGEEAFNAARYEEAYREFQAGYALVPRPAFLVNMAAAERKRGELRNARALYKKYLLVDPDTNLRAEVENVIQEIDSAITAEEAAAARAAAAVAPPPGDPTSSISPPPLGAAGGLSPGGTGPTGASEAAAGGLGSAGGGDGERGDKDRIMGGGRWWMWALVGGVLVAGAATALLLSRESYQKSGTLGTLK